MFRVFLIGLLACLAAPALTAPKSSWSFSGRLAYPNSVSPSDRENLNGEVSLTRRYYWKGTPKTGDWIVYGTLSGQRDSEKNTYNSKQKLSFGAKVKYRLKRGSNLSVGLRYDFDNRDLSHRRYSLLVFKVDYGLWRRLEPSQSGNPRTLSGWANARYPGGSDESNKTNWVSQGRFEISEQLEAKLWDAPRAPRLIGFVGMGFAADTEGFSYNNKIKADTGLRLKWKWGKSGSLSLTGRYLLDHRPKAGETMEGATMSLSWYRKF